jgi:hypothetical protein
LTVVDERGFGDDGKTQERKKGFVTVADIDAAVRLSAAINARCVRPCVYVCVCFAPGSSGAFVVVVRFAAFVCAAVLLFFPPSSILQRFASVLTLPCCVVEVPLFETGSEVVFALLDRSKGRPIANERASKRSRQTDRQTDR